MTDMFDEIVHTELKQADSGPVIVVNYHHELTAHEFEKLITHLNGKAKILRAASDKQARAARGGFGGG